nr:unnamed protein product [Digitaria exilis]
MMASGRGVRIDIRGMALPSRLEQWSSSKPQTLLPQLQASSSRGQASRATSTCGSSAEVDTRRAEHEDEQEQLRQAEHAAGLQAVIEILSSSELPDSD